MSYRSHADLGGEPIAAPVVAEPEAVSFHNRWEPRVLALTLAMGATGSWNIDMTRAARETLPDYRELDYYRIWFGALCRLLLTHGLVTAEELDAGRSLLPPRAVPRVLAAAKVATVLASGAPTERPRALPPRFTIGERVRTRREAAPHHTRLPGYARGRIGTVESLHGAHVFADAHAHGRGEQPEWLYTVVFDEAELWGERTPAQRLAVSIDAWEPYLERA